MLKPSVELTQRDGVLHAEFWDCMRLDPNPVRDLRNAYESHVAKGGVAAVVVDLSGVGFAGSAALGGFVALRKLGARVVFYNVEATVREVFRVSNLESLFQFANDLPAALAEAVAKPNSGPRPAESGSGRTAVASPPTPPPLRRVRRGEK